MSQTLADDSEVVFDQPGKSAGVMEPEGLVSSRRKEETWLEDTEPHQGARRRTMEFDRLVDGELGAASGGVEDKDSLRDDVVPELRPEQQIQNEEEIRKEPRAKDSIGQDCVLLVFQLPVVHHLRFVDGTLYGLYSSVH